MRPILYISHIPIPALTRLPRQRFKIDWEGKRLEFRAEFVLALDPDALHYATWCDVAPDYDPELKCGQFAERLWERDVAELFLPQAKSDSTRYQEWNIGPQGAWWSQVYVDQRVPDKQAAAPRASKTEGRISEDGWQTYLKIPRRSLAATVPQRLNVTMIAGGAAGPRRFLSCARDPESPPDFHRIDTYLRVEMTEIQWEKSGPE